jgi:hypothetical protein
MKVQEAPLAYRVVRRDTRRFLLQRFPYQLLYWLVGDTIAVVACFHGRRSPQHGAMSRETVSKARFSTWSRRVNRAAPQVARCWRSWPRRVHRDAAAARGGGAPPTHRPYIEGSRSGIERSFSWGPPSPSPRYLALTISRRLAPSKHHLSQNVDSIPQCAGAMVPSPTAKRSPWMAATASSAMWTASQSAEIASQSG